MLSSCCCKVSGAFTGTVTYCSSLRNLDLLRPNGMDQKRLWMKFPSVPLVLLAGYLTPPGGAAYWADCWYPLFVAYVCCNGFALVFSVAAIMAVLVGPIILVCMDRPNWRLQIALLAIIHLAFSLASFLPRSHSPGSSLHRSKHRRITVAT